VVKRLNRVPDRRRSRHPAADPDVFDTAGQLA